MIYMIYNSCELINGETEPVLIELLHPNSHVMKLLLSTEAVPAAVVLIQWLLIKTPELTYIFLLCWARVKTKGHEALLYTLLLFKKALFSISTVYEISISCSLTVVIRHNCHISIRLSLHFSLYLSSYQV